MNDKNKKTLKKYLLTVAIAAFVTFSLLSAFGIFSGELNAEEMMRAFADAFTACGVVLLALFCLVFVSTEGMFDGVSYAGKIALGAFVPGMRKNPKEKYGDYKVRKSEQRITGYSFLLFVGIAFTLVGIIFTILYFVV